MKLAMIGVLALFCARPVFADAFDQTVGQLEADTWGWPDGENTCDLNPQKLSFSEDRGTLTITWRHTHKPAIYHLKTAMSRMFVADIEGETRLTDAGVPVQWMLLMTGSDTFCWHRMDWGFGTCTKNQVRCDEKIPNS